MRPIIAILVLSIPAVCQPPQTPVHPVTDVIHGVSITDPYRWLEDQNSPQTRAWIDAQMKYTEAELAKAPGRQELHDRIAALLKTERIGMPVEEAGRYFYSRRNADQNQSVLYVREGLGGKDRVLVDPNPLSPDHSTSAVLLDVSHDGKIAAYGVRQGGEDELALDFVDVASGRHLADHFAKVRLGGVAILHDDSGLYYGRFTSAGPRVLYHKFGAAVASDRMVFGEKYGPEYFIGVGLSDSGRYLIYDVEFGAAGTRTEVYVQDLVRKTPPERIVGGIDAHFEPAIAGSTMYLRTNWKAPNWRIIAIDLDHPAENRWREVVPERSYVLDSFAPAGGDLVLDYMKDVASYLEVVDANGRHIRDIALPGIGTVRGISSHWASNQLFYGYTSFVVPGTIYRYDVASGRDRLWARERIPFDSQDMEVKQVWYQSKDKTRVPMFLVYRKGLKLDGDRPVYLTGYGGFDISMQPSFSPTAVVWTQMGGVFALPNLRGGGEFGEKWHRAGMFQNKQNVFDDFIAAAEYLIQNHYTKPSRLAISGGSNGGLLVGAAMTQRPDLFQAVLCVAPLLDMIRYQKFKVARFWVSEYGSSDNAEQFKYILKYSPYQHVDKGVKYPAVMFVTGDADTRVDPLHARKMCALMQASTASKRPILLHYRTKAGHSAGLPVSEQIEDSTDMLLFLTWQLGMK
jgi:prolyl oligopeptidase